MRNATRNLVNSKLYENFIEISNSLININTDKFLFPYMYKYAYIIISIATKACPAQLVYY